MLVVPDYVVTIDYLEDRLKEINSKIETVASNAMHVHSENVQLRQDLQAEFAGAEALRNKGGAFENETLFTFFRRVLKEREIAITRADAVEAKLARCEEAIHDLIESYDLLTGDHSPFKNNETALGVIRGFFLASLRIHDSERFNGFANSTEIPGDQPLETH